ncbi:hypothetical protein E4T56_gene3298 [Termitomyces sp. T112]|nr:hypothetical protein E4T56_gene3298 [Termitomyces sp. T112]
MEGWGKEGTLDPFEEVYELVFQMTVRRTTRRGLSEDKGAISQLVQLYWELEKYATPFRAPIPTVTLPREEARGNAEIVCSSVKICESSSQSH